MKKLLLGTVALAALGVPAIAADMGVRPVARPVVAYANWTGCHVGGLVGYEWGSTDGFTTTGASTVIGFGAAAPFNGAAVFAGQQATPGFNTSGFNGGGYAGCDYQFSNWVVGVEGDWSVMNNSGQGGPGQQPLFTSVGPGGIHPFTYGELQERWYATVRGRLGYAVDKWLFFVSGGGAWTRIDASRFDLLDVGSVALHNQQQNDTRSGWTVGGGIDYAITGASLMPGWSVRVEYLYVQFKDYTTFTTPLVSGPAGAIPISHVTNLNTNLKDNIVRVGFAYKFGNYGYRY